MTWDFTFTVTIWDVLIMAVVFWVIMNVSIEQEWKVIQYISTWFMLGFLAMFLVRIVPQLWQYASSL